MTHGVAIKVLIVLFLFFSAYSAASAVDPIRRGLEVTMDQTNDTRMRQELSTLLGQQPESVKAWESQAFDAAADGKSSSLVLFGAGGLGRRMLAGLRALGITPLAFADNNPASWNTVIDGVRVLSPKDAVERFGNNAAFVITIWRAGGKHRLAQFRRQLHDLGCQTAFSFGLLCWKYPDVFLPHYCLDLPHRVIEDGQAARDCFDLWKDDASRNEYLAQLRWRLRLDFDGLPSPVPGDQYFPDGLFSWREDEVFVDCGAFDGDTLKVIVRRNGARFNQIIALEPDPTNFAKLTAYHASLPDELARKVTLLELAAGSREEIVRFDATGTASSTLGTGAVEVRCAPLDAVLDGYKVTFLKMDIEGAEPAALIGAVNLIQRCRPILAVCVYHRQDHLWKLPLWIARHVSNYHFFLRPHNEECWDLVCYAVPTERLLKMADSGMKDQ